MHKQMRARVFQRECIGNSLFAKLNESLTHLLRSEGLGTRHLPRPVVPVQASFPAGAHGDRGPPDADAHLAFVDLPESRDSDRAAVGVGVGRGGKDEQHVIIEGAISFAEFGKHRGRQSAEVDCNFGRHG